MAGRNKSRVRAEVTVYTVAFGDSFFPQAAPRWEGAEYLCFTDRPPSKKVDGWEYRLLTPTFNTDTARSSRVPKIQPHLLELDTEISLYLDTSVSLKVSPQELLAFLLPYEKNVFGAMTIDPEHSVNDEIELLQRLGFDSRSTLRRALTEAESVIPEYSSRSTIWGGVIARRHNNSNCVKAMNFWQNQVARYSRRDQISLPLALSLNVDAAQQHLPRMNPKDNPFVLWPNPTTRKKPESYRLEAVLDSRSENVYELESKIEDLTRAVSERELQLKKIRRSWIVRLAVAWGRQLSRIMRFCAKLSLPRT